METPDDRVSLIREHLFDTCKVLRNVKLKKRQYLGKSMVRSIVRDEDTLEYADFSEGVESNGSQCFVKKHAILPPPNYEAPICIGIDTSYGSPYRIVKGNSTYAWAIVLSSMVDGDVSEEVTREVRRLIKYVLLVSDQHFEQKRGLGERSCIAPHHRLQDTLFNMLKVVAEGKMISAPLSRLVGTLGAYGYNYSRDSCKRTMIIKDGPLLSGFFGPFGNALINGQFRGRLEDDFKIYQSITAASLAGIPVIGITKQPTYALLSQFYGDADFSDYSILRQIAGRDSYFYVGPFERKHNKNKSFIIHYYYPYLESRFSPLRVEILPNLLPAGLDGKTIIEDLICSLKCDGYAELEHRGESYKLPRCIAEVDQQTREIVKRKSQELYEAMENVRKSLPGSVIARG